MYSLPHESESRSRTPYLSLCQELLYRAAGCAPAGMSAGSPAAAQSSHSGVSAQRGSTGGPEQVESIAARAQSHSGSCYGDAVVDILALSPAVANAEVSSAERPSDEQIIAQENAIRCVSAWCAGHRLRCSSVCTLVCSTQQHGLCRASEAEKLSFVGDIEPLAALVKGA